MAEAARVFGGDGFSESSTGLYVPDRRMYRAESFPAEQNRRAGRDRRALAGGARRAPRISVVIPTLNEEKNLPYVFESLPSDLHEIIVVDGFSTDNTVTMARTLHPDVKVVYQTRRGKGNALRCGFEACTGDLIVMLDADGSTSGAEIPRFVELLHSQADFVKGSRFMRGGGSADLTRVRRLGNWGLNTLVNVLYGTTYTDLCYGYNAFWRRVLTHFEVDCDGFEVETLINIRVAKAGLRVLEAPSFEDHRLYGSSNLNAWRDGRRVLKTILKERFVSRGLVVPGESGRIISAAELREASREAEREGMLVG